MSVPPNLSARYLVTTVLIAAGVAWSVVDRSPQRAPTALTRSASPASAHARVVVRPTAADLLVRGDLALTPPQRARLAALAAGWQHEIAPLTAATDEVTRYMTAAEGGGRVRFADIRARSLEVEAASAALREHRARHSETALAVLTQAQQRRVRGGAR